MCYLRDCYNQLNRKQYEEYFKRLNKYYLYKKKYYEGSHNTSAKERQSKKNKYKSVKKIYKKHYTNKPCDPIDKIQEDKCNIEICETTVSSETLPICENSPHTSDVTAGPVIVKLPVVLTECSITITVESLLKLEDTVLEIKHIRKNAYLNQCKLIPNSENGQPNTGILFLAGFIRKNIEYFNKEHNHKGTVNGRLKHATVNVPFKCTTRVTFNTPPKFKINTPQNKVEILQSDVGVCNPCGGISGRDIREQNFRLIEFFNEKVFCELISAEFIESDILENPTNKKECKSHHEQAFHDINEKLILLLTIKLLQNQNVIIPK
ncbi:CsxC family protein [Clostridium sp.]|uniref:CsxC family protein n=1 Tax=Clostridium sp. TaxID=1506 RepID=UPI0028405940|nr:hypothetical protein [Clostridium sp.]MDR3597368.1 hypothetical protein [Clostridium sp.]